MKWKLFGTGNLLLQHLVSNCLHDQGILIETKVIHPMILIVAKVCSQYSSFIIVSELI